MYFKTYDGGKKFKTEKQLIDRDGKIISHVTILLKGISVLIGEVKIYTPIPSWTINNNLIFF